MKKLSFIQKLAWVYAAGFLLVVLISHWPGLTDESGRLLGLFFIDPIDDIFHLLSGVYAVIAALCSPRAATIYFRIVSIPYIIDALTGLLFSRQFLNMDVFTMGLGAPDFTLNNFLIQLPHIVIAGFALYVGFWAYKKWENK